MIYRTVTKCHECGRLWSYTTLRCDGVFKHLHEIIINYLFRLYITNYEITAETGN